MAKKKSDTNRTGRERLSSPEFLKKWRSLIATTDFQKELRKRVSEAIQGGRNNLQRLFAARLIDQVPDDSWLEEVYEAGKIAGVADIDNLTLGELVEQCELITKRERWKGKLQAEEFAKLLAEALNQQKMPPRPPAIQSGTPQVWHEADETPSKVAPKGVPGRKTAPAKAEHAMKANNLRCLLPQPGWKSVAKSVNTHFKLTGDNEYTDEQIRGLHRDHYGDKAQKKKRG